MPTFREPCLIQYQATLRPDEVNCKVHETSALNNGITQKPLSTSKEYTRGSLKSLIKILYFYIA